jgi:glycine/sarcosine N-methyltransferase
MNDSRKWSRAQFRSQVAWPSRILREEPFLNHTLDMAPEKSLLDLGCGTGEHARHYASRGFRVVGVDASEETIEVAIREAFASHEAEARPADNPRFVAGDMRAVDHLVSGTRFGAALCLGNTLPFLTGAHDLDVAFSALSRALLPGGVVVIQVLNYEGLRGRNARHLALNFQPSDEGELVFLRLLDFPDETRVLFFPTTLRLRSQDPENPLELLRTHRIELRTWTRGDLASALDKAGFTVSGCHGTMEGAPFDSATSPDLVVVARRSS